MATPLIAGFRIAVPVTVPGVRTHQHRIFCSASANSAITSGWDINTRGGGQLDVAQVTSDYVPLLYPLYPGPTQIGPAVLEQFVGGAWVPVYEDIVSGNGTASGSTVLAQQTSLTLRATVGPERYRLQLMELSSGVASLQGKFTSPSGISPAALSAWVANFITDVPGFAFNWARNRGNNFNIGMVGLVFAENKKIRRARGLA